jgi:hypothetical protein
MTSSITVRGGTPATRQKILYDRFNEIILQFLQEGNTNPTPIQYTLTPVWQILGEHQDYKVQAINLEYYFNGFLNFGCNYLPGIVAIEILPKGITPQKDYSPKGLLPKGITPQRDYSPKGLLPKGITPHSLQNIEILTLFQIKIYMSFHILFQIL